MKQLNKWQGGIRSHDEQVDILCNITTALPIAVEMYTYTDLRSCYLMYPCYGLSTFLRRFGDKTWKIIRHHPWESTPKVSCITPINSTILANGNFRRGNILHRT